MFKPFAIFPIVAAVALAQTSQSSLIPAGISDTCTKYLTDLNNHNDFKACTSAVTSATSTLTGAKNATEEKVTSALGAFCATTVSDACPDDLVGSILAKFYTACSAELTSAPNKDVIRIYDNVFILIPFRKAICVTDNTGSYCSTQSKIPSSTDANALQKVLSSPSSGNPAALVPNPNTITTYNIPFLFRDPSDNATQLCTDCTRKMINAYTDFESSNQYGPGLAQSAYLSGQGKLYDGIKKVCGDTFLQDTGVVKAAGGLAGGTLGGTNGAVQLSGVTGGLVATSMSVIALVASSLL